MRERKHTLMLYLSDKEYEYLERNVKKTGISKSSFVRKLILGIEIHQKPPDEYFKLIREVNAIGNNINQIAHIANAEKHISQEKIAEVIQLQNNLIRAVRRDVSWQ